MGRAYYGEKRVACIREPLDRGRQTAPIAVRWCLEAIATYLRNMGSRFSIGDATAERCDGVQFLGAGATTVSGIRSRLVRDAASPGNADDPRWPGSGQDDRP